MGEVMQSCELVTFISTLACCIAKDKSIEEISMLSAIFVLLGDNLDAIATREEICKGRVDEILQ